MTNKPIVGAGTESSITLGPWAVTVRDYTTYVLYKYASSTITITSPVITYPEDLNISFTGEGTADSPYIISTATELQMLSQSVADGNTYKGKYFKQTANIDLSSLTSSYIPVGDTSTSFEAAYDGGNYTISNLTLDRKGFSNSGIFGYLGENATVTNLNIDGFSLAASGTNLGVLAGINYGTISNCHITNSTIEANCEIAGGIAGVSYGTITNSSFSGNVYNIGIVGGIVGQNLGIISSSYATGLVSLTGYYSSTAHYAGGLAGFSSPAVENGCKITDSYFSGEVADNYGYGIIGGLIGAFLNADMERCFTVGMVVAGDDTAENTTTGGLFGFLSKANITDCYNAATVVKTASGNENVGGIAGYISVTYLNGVTINNLSNIKNCYNSGLINSSSTHSRSGLFGTTFVFNNIDPIEYTFTNSYSDSQITGLEHETYGKQTSYFIGGTLPEGFSSDVWEAVSGSYPTLKSISDCAAKQLSAASISLSNDETMRKVKSQFTLNTPSSNIKWGIYNNKQISTSSDALTISGTTVSIKDIYSTEQILAYTSDGSCMKMYLLAIVPKVFEGDGTEASPYLISSVSDFEKLNNAVEGNAQPHEGDFFKMTADIDFAGSSFAGVSGNTTYAFGGTFDGDNHTIHNLSITSFTYDESGKATTTDAYYYAGLFGVCSESSTIKNLNIASDCKFDFFGVSAPIAGYTAGKIENCRNYADVSGIFQYVSGIAAYTTATATVTNCYNAGHIICGNTGVGGIVSYNIGAVELCQNDGEIEAAYVNSYTADGSQNIAGGITAYNFGSIDRCLNNATVSAYERVGGLTGANSTSYEAGHITNSINNGLVVCKKDETTRGGIIGYNASKGTVSGNYYDSSIVPFGAASNASINGVTALSTSALISGNALDGLSTDDFTFTAGAYPVLKAFAEETVGAALRKIYVAFADGESTSNIVKSTSLATDSKIVWTLKQNKNFTITDNILNVTVPTDMTVAKDTLTAVYDGTYTKVYYVNSIPAILNGAGTESDPFQITSVDDMNTLADFMASSSMEYNGYYFKVLNDIDYAGATFNLIATGSVNFQGDFDGNGKTIKGFIYESTSTKSGIGRYIGPFTNVGGNGIIHDLTLEGTFTGNAYIGGLVGNLYGTIRNCVNKSTITTTNSGYAGGLVYKAFEGAVIDNCSNEGTVTTKTTYCAGIVSLATEGTTISNCTNKGIVTGTTGFAAGIVASNNGKVIGSSNTGTVTGKTAVGGIVAKGGLRDSIINCFNTADIAVTNATGGGIVASTTAKASGIIQNCYNTGNISGTGTIGGIAGEINSGNCVDNCYNTGNITSNKSSYTGGVCGKISGDYDDYPTNVTNCYNVGNIISVTNYSGGFSGYVYNSTISDCYNTGDVTVNGTAKSLAVGGFSGSFGGTGYNCWTSGDVTSIGYGVGGFAGIGSGEIHNCANLGDVTSTQGLGNTGSYGNVGGLWGYGKAAIYDSYNTGTLTAPSYIAGINGRAFSGAIIQNCYNAGKIVATSTEGVANITYYTSSNVPECTNVYYDSTINPTSYEVDSLATGLSTQELFAAELGENFTNHNAAYPTLVDFADNVRANFAAANIGFSVEGDDASKVSDNMYVAPLTGLTITASENIEVIADMAYPNEIGAGWIKYSATVDGETLEKQFDVTITVISGIENVLDGGKTAISRNYYNLQGVEIENPAAGQFYIVKSKYTDGSDSVNKIYLRD